MNLTVRGKQIALLRLIVFLDCTISLAWKSGTAAHGNYSPGRRAKSIVEESFTRRINRRRRKQKIGGRTQCSAGLAIRGSAKTWHQSASVTFFLDRFSLVSCARHSSIGTMCHHHKCRWQSLQIGDVDADDFTRMCTVPLTVYVCLNKLLSAF